MRGWHQVLAIVLLVRLAVSPHVVLVDASNLPSTLPNITQFCLHMCRKHLTSAKDAMPSGILQTPAEIPIQPLCRCRRA